MSDFTVEPFLDGGKASVSMLSRAFGIARETVRKRLADAGVTPVKGEGGNPVFPLVPAIQALRKAEHLTLEGALTDEQAAALPPQERKQWFESESKRIAVEREKGNLVEADDARLHYAEIVNITVAVFDSIPYSLERECRLSAEQVALVEKKLDHVRNDLAARLKS